MRTLAVLLTLLVTAPQAATDQKPVPDGTTIASAQVTGFDADRLSPGLREAIRSLAGTPLKQERLDEIVARLEAERPRWVAASRAVLDADGRARVSFLMGRREPPEQGENVNDRYIVDEARIIGLADDKWSQALRDDLAAIVGKRLDSEDAQRLERRIESDLVDYHVSRQIRRGGEPGHIRLLYDVRKKEPPPWLRFEPLRTNALFHSEQGFGFFGEIPMGDGAFRVTPTAALDNADDLVEEYSGYGVRIETRRLGTRRLGASLEWSWFDNDWRDATLAALAVNPNIPSIYENRSTITPLLKFAFTPHLSVAGGVSISELEPFTPGADSQMANAAVAAVEFDRRWRDTTRAEHHVAGSFGMRAGSRELESDLAYTKYLGQGAYRYDFGRHHVQVAGMAGTISGRPPLFERFTLGDSTTLRGWDKYDIAPAGGDRMVYSSVEYRYTGLALFLDVGSVWDATTVKQIRVSTGIGLHAGPAFFTLGFPLNTDDLRAIVTMGLRIPGVGFKW